MQNDLNAFFRDAKLTVESATEFELREFSMFYRLSHGAINPTQFITRCISMSVEHPRRKRVYFQLQFCNAKISEEVALKTHFVQFPKQITVYL